MRKSAENPGHAASPTTYSRALAQASLSEQMGLILPDVLGRACRAIGGNTPQLAHDADVGFACDESNYDAGVPLVRTGEIGLF